jgi:hypothetical protein
MSAARAVRLEQLWGLIAQTFVLDLLCGYLSALLEKQNDILESICAEHSAVYSG